jgi:hypothetical protein
MKRLICAWNASAQRSSCCGISGKPSGDCQRLLSGLPSHPQHQLCKDKCAQVGGNCDVEGDIQSLKRFIGGLHYFVLAESLGGVESMINHSASMSHGSMSKEEREAIGVYDTTLRFSVGIEHIDDLLQDLDIASLLWTSHRVTIMHDYGIWTIITPLVTIILAILTRQVILSLLTGIFVGYGD